VPNGSIPDMSQNIASRSASAIKWNVVSNVVTIVFGFVQTIWLARLLPVEVFGIYAFAHAIMWVTNTVANMGFHDAFLHRAEETANEELTLGVYMSLRLIFTGMWVVVLISATLLLTQDTALRLALIVLVLANSISQILQVQRFIYIRRVQHQRLAIVQIFNSVITATASVGLALAGAGLWALLVSSIVTAALYIFAFVIWKPIWKIRLLWDKIIVRYFLNFGSRVMVGHFLLFAVDRFDDIWTSIFLGKIPLGFYSQAFTFATYPRLILANPINVVVSGVYAELYDQQDKLSAAFSQFNRLMLRVSFMLAGGLALVTPEFINLLLGDKWLPMLGAFRFMLIFTMLDPTREIIAQLFVAMGKPEIVIQTRLVQLVILILGLFGLGTSAGITGVAIAVDVMLVVGIVHMLWHARKYVTFSLTDFFATPLIALTVSLVAGYSVGLIDFVAQSDWIALLVKSTVLALTYLIVWFVLEPNTLTYLLNEILSYVRKRKQR
jgi:O-antigen/teichoic acid export membrane protein